MIAEVTIEQISGGGRVRAKKRKVETRGDHQELN